MSSLAARLRRATRGLPRTAAAVPAAADDRLAPILFTPPVAIETIESSAALGVHILGQDAQLLPALWALKTFYHYSGGRYPLTVHLQGRHTEQLQAGLHHHFPNARLVTQEAADAVVEPWLRDRGLSRLLAARRDLFLMMKLIDLPLLARTPLILFFDTDVLFFRRPDEMLVWPGMPASASDLFMQDDYPSYCITTAEAQADLGVALKPFANSGLMRLRRHGIDLAACERFLTHPALAGRHWHLEQTLHALNASAHGRLELLPRTYGMTEGLPARPGLIARHYISPLRPLLAEEGVAHLVDSGFLAALACSR